MVQAILGEFIHEAENTRKLLNSIPQSALGYRLSEKSWTTAGLASHTANIYNCYTGITTAPVFNKPPLSTTEKIPLLSGYITRYLLVQSSHLLICSHGAQLNKYFYGLIAI